MQAGPAEIEFEIAYGAVELCQIVWIGGRAQDPQSFGERLESSSVRGLQLLVES